MTNPDESPLRHLLIRSPNWLGDACMAVPAVRALKRMPHVFTVTILTPEKLAAVWRIVADVDHIVVQPHRAGVLKTARLIRTAGRKFDGGILFPNSLRSALEVRLASIPHVIGYAGHWRRRLLHRIIPPKQRPGPVAHHTRHYLRIALRLGADVEEASLHDPVAAPPGAALPPPDPNGPVFGLCPGAEYGPAKRWPIERFAEVARQVSAQTGARWQIFGTSAEAAHGRQLASMIGEPATSMAGQTTLEDLITHLRACRLLLTNDTGTMHLATLLGVPVVAIFGSTDPAATGPRGAQDTVVRRHVECSPCFLRQCPLDFRCMLEIRPERVTRAILETGRQQRVVAINHANT